MKVLAWLRPVNIVNKLVSFGFFIYLFFVAGFVRSMKFGAIAVLAFFLVGLVGSAANMRAANDPHERLAIATGRMPLRMARILLVTTLVLIISNISLIWFFAP